MMMSWYSSEPWFDLGFDPHPHSRKLKDYWMEFFLLLSIKNNVRKQIGSLGVVMISTYSYEPGFLLKHEIITHYEFRFHFEYRNCCTLTLVLLLDVLSVRYVKPAEVIRMIYAKYIPAVREPLGVPNVENPTFLLFIDLLKDFRVSHLHIFTHTNSWNR